MSTIIDLATEYANYLRINRDNPNAASEIAKRISDLTYTSSGQPISPDDKQSLITHLTEQLQPRKTTRGGMMLTEAEDISALLAMVEKIKAMLK